MSTIDKGINPGSVYIGFNQTNKFHTKTKSEKNLIEKRELDTIEDIFHIELNDHTFILPFETGMNGLLHLDHIVY